MTHRGIALAALLGLALVPTKAAAASGVQRFALVAAANDGGSDRPLENGYDSMVANAARSCRW